MRENGCVGENRTRLLTSSFSKYSRKLTFTNKMKCFHLFFYISVLCHQFTLVALTPGNEIKAEGSSLMLTSSGHVSLCIDAVSIHTNCYPSCSSASVIPVTKMADWWVINWVWNSWVLSLAHPLRRPVARLALRILVVKMIMNTNSPWPKSKTSPGFSNLILQHDDKLPVWTNKSILHTDGQLLKKNRHRKRAADRHALSIKLTQKKELFSLYIDCL